MRIFAAFIASIIALASSTFAGEVEIQLDQARLYALERAVGSIVVANPSIADVAVHSSKELVLFGKMPGLTNLFVFDTEGRAMGSVSLRVTNSTKNTVTIFAGTNRTTMSCASVCEHTYTIGDGVNGMRAQGTGVASQATLRFDMATNAADGSVNSTQSEIPSSHKASDEPES